MISSFHRTGNVAPTDLLVFSLEALMVAVVTPALGYNDEAFGLQTPSSKANTLWFDFGWVMDGGTSAYFHAAR